MTNYDTGDSGRVVSEVTGIIVKQNLDNSGLVTDSSHAVTTSFDYDHLGNVIRTTVVDASTSTTTTMQASFDAQGRKLSETNQMGQTRTFEYDSLGRLTAVELPAVEDPANPGNTVNPRYEYAYDADGNQTLIRDPLGRETVLAYDEVGRQTSRTLPLGFGD